MPHPVARPAPPVPVARPSPASRGAIGLALISAIAGIAWGGSILWREWQGLRSDWVVQQHHAIIGYVNIAPRRSMAAKPADWFHEEGETARLWSGWTPGVGHGWFRFGRGEIDPSALSEPIGRDVISAIERPIVEVGGGPRWDRIPSDAPVFEFRAGGVSTAYPLLLMEKVEVVNDRIGGRPYLVVFTPTRGPDGDVDVYDTRLDGARVVLGHSGYFRERDPLLYDLGTESFWVSRREGLTAIAGARKGARLRRLARPLQVAWSDWRSGHPAGRLIVGGEDRRGPDAR